MTEPCIVVCPHCHTLTNRVRADQLGSADLRPRASSRCLRPAGGAE